MTTTSQTPVDELLDRLALVEPSEFPVVSLYLDTRPNQVGRDGGGPFLRKELRHRIASYPPRSPERENLEADAAAIQEYVENQLPHDANTLALYACSAMGLFEALPLEAVLGESSLFLGRQPQLYPLARLVDQYRRYAALLADGHVARVFVFGLGRELAETAVTNDKTRRTQVGGWSQMRYQRHVDNQHLKHAKEAAATLTQVVRDEAIDHVILSGDEVNLAMLREELPKEVTDKVIDTLSLPVRTPEHEVLAATLEAFRRHDAGSDVESVTTLLDEYRGGGLAVVGQHDTLAALEAGQVDELVLAAAPIALDRADVSEEEATRSALPPEELARREALAGDLVARARRTAASVRFIEDSRLLWEHGGVGAFLRYRLTPDGPAVPPVDVPELAS